MQRECGVHRNGKPQLKFAIEATQHRATFTPSLPPPSLFATNCEDTHAGILLSSAGHQRVTWNRATVSGSGNCLAIVLSTNQNATPHMTYLNDRAKQCVCVVLGAAEAGSARARVCVCACVCVMFGDWEWGEICVRVKPHLQLRIQKQMLSEMARYITSTRVIEIVRG